jgi:hypothetical protein
MLTYMNSAAAASTTAQTHNFGIPDPLPTLLVARLPPAPVPSNPAPVGALPSARAKAAAVLTQRREVHRATAKENAFHWDFAMLPVRGFNPR